MQCCFESSEATSETSAEKAHTVLGIKCSDAPFSVTESMQQVRLHMPAYAASHRFTRDMEQMKVKIVVSLHYFH